MENELIGLNDFAIILDNVVIEENITQERAFELLQNHENAILQVWYGGWINVE